jgi:hypothetical protein
MAAMAPTTRRRTRLGPANHEEYDMQFLISMLINPAVLDALTDQEKAAIGEGHGRFIQALKQSGELITTQALVDPSPYGHDSPDGLSSPPRVQPSATHTAPDGIPWSR